MGIKTKQTTINFQIGFTLIELLVVVAITAIIGTVAAITLFSLLRGAGKTETIKEVKQNGDYALSSMEIKIRNSTIDDANCYAADTSLTIDNVDGSETIFSCVANGSINSLTQQNVSVPLPSPGYLTNTSVTVNSCSGIFVCSVVGNKKNVNIRFVLQQSGAGEQIGARVSQTFQTQISLRN